MPPDDKLDGEWLEALEVEAPADDAPADDTPVDDKPADDTSTDDKETDDGSDDTSDNDDSDGDSDSSDDGGEQDELPKEKEEPDEKASTKEAIKEALAEIDNAKQAKTDTIQAFKKEVTETLYPEGIDRQLRDSDGDPITGIDDLTKLINPRTGELFTDEEAGSWLLQAQQKLNKDIEQVENFIEQVAEVNANVKSGAERVAEKYGDILRADDKLRVRLIQAYDKTLVKDPKTGVTINNPIDVEEFFDMALEPRMAAKIEADQAAAEAAKAKAKEDAKNAQSDRGDLKPNGKADNIDPADKEWAQAYKEYEEGK
jgi:hypothetical protein